MSKTNNNVFYKLLNNIKTTFTNNKGTNINNNKIKLKDVVISEEQKKLDENTYKMLIDRHKKIDLKKFNKEFERRKDLTKKQSSENIKKRLGVLNKPKKIKKIYEQSIGEILINTKNAWISLLDDLINGNFNMSIFTTENRLFYIGLTIILISIILYLFSSSKKDIDCDNTKKVYHIYKHE
jgi:hypothetical protein